MWTLLEGLLRSQALWQQRRPLRRRETDIAHCSLSRLLILTWLITWVTTLPLFHLHVPDATDDWSALKSGGAHTVFTPNLPGEFAPPFHDHQPRQAGHLSQRGVNSPELGLTLLEVGKWKVLDSLGAPSRVLDIPLQPSVSVAWPGEPEILHLIFYAFPVSRAPPHLVYR